MKDCAFNDSRRAALFYSLCYQVLIAGTEKFNNSYKEGISHLQKNGLLAEPLDPSEIAVFLRDNPGLDKKMIGDYVSAKKNAKILKAFVEWVKGL